MPERIDVEEWERQMGETAAVFNWWAARYPVDRRELIELARDWRLDERMRLITRNNIPSFRNDHLVCSVLDAIVQCRGVAPTPLVNGRRPENPLTRDFVALCRARHKASNAQPPIMRSPPPPAPASRGRRVWPLRIIASQPLQEPQQLAIRPVAQWWARHLLDP